MRSPGYNTLHYLRYKQLRQQLVDDKIPQDGRENSLCREFLDTETYIVSPANDVTTNPSFNIRCRLTKSVFYITAFERSYP